MAQIVANAVGTVAPLDYRTRSARLVDFWSSVEVAEYRFGELAIGRAGAGLEDVNNDFA